VCTARASVIAHIMARRKKSDLAQDLYELFMQVPTWICLPLSILSYFVIQWVGVSILSKNPGTAALTPILPKLGGFVAFVVLRSGLRA
jgi:hypothetical protein